MRQVRYRTYIVGVKDIKIFSFGVSYDEQEPFSRIESKEDAL
jgi:hypothetical protein